jgi:hypothetical protein
MLPRVHITDVNVCSMCVSQVEGVYMDPMLAWGFHNILIVHGKHINVGCTMVGLFGVEIMSQFFFVHGMC